MSIKIYKFNLDAFFASKFFSPIRSNEDIYILLMNTIDFITIYKSLGIKSDESKIGEITVVVDKMSRIFYHSSMKHFSVACPFFIQEDDSSGGISFHSKGAGEVNTWITSITRRILSGKMHAYNCVGSFADKVLDQDIYAENVWSLLSELFTFESGYLRYDIDPEPSRCCPVNHPLHHIDLFFSNKATFKIGIERELTSDNFIDMLNNNTAVKYIKG
ncbi:hypothetical protein [Aeromonas jandaei]|uniref:hypothetical protein n=1 Tax=Aeromonas jandaei TaxID=650 RepID=UPI003BA31987